jgi:2-polyprenyl-6-methoxyphenol hydroxylase-like FAD-dependent oxidoreductase
MDQFTSGRDLAGARATPVGKTAVVVGAGIAGLTAAGALADWFEQVVVLDRDPLPDTPMHRPSTPQSRHSHGLLVGGLLAQDALFPGIADDFASAGAVSVRINRDLREEPAHRDPMPQRDFGRSALAMSRPLLEFTLRGRAAQLPNVTFRPATRMIGLIKEQKERRITGVRCSAVDGHGIETLPADLVIDASGRGHLTAAVLQCMGHERPRETAVGIDLRYTTAVLPVPDDAPAAWKLVLTHHDAPRSSRRAILLPMEGDRWMLSAMGRGKQEPPADWDSLLRFLRQLTTPTIYNAVRKLTPMGELTRFAFTESIWRHFEEVEAFPDGLIPIGDAICRFNPLYGQGMTVASKEAQLLHRMLASRASEDDPLEGLGRAFLAEATPLIETPWMMAAIPDFVFPETRGERPVDLEERLRFAGALSRVAARDAAVQRLAIEVWHMLRPRSAYQDPELVRLIEEEMAMA